MDKITQALDLFSKIRKAWFWLIGVLLLGAVGLSWLANNPRFPDAKAMLSFKNILAQYIPVAQEILLPTMNIFFWTIVALGSLLLFRKRISWIDRRIKRPIARLTGCLIYLGCLYTVAIIIATPTLTDAINWLDTDRSLPTILAFIGTFLCIAEIVLGHCAR
jgi:hypothetical protein